MTNQPARIINRVRPEQLSGMGSESQGLIVISTGFEPADKQQAHPPGRHQLTVEALDLLGDCVRLLRRGGLLFVYGSPRELAVWGEYLALLQNESSRMVFKYWIALDIDDVPPNRFLKPSHLGLLLLMKDYLGKKTPASFRLNTDLIRIPHAYCAACGQNVKDWGGKKHLMNPRGAAPSDVWRDLPRRPICDGVIPEDVLGRILALGEDYQQNSLTEPQDCSSRRELAHTPFSIQLERTVVHCSEVHGEAVNGAALHIALEPGGVQRVTQNAPASAQESLASEARQWAKLERLEADHVYLGDCVSFLKRMRALYSEGLFDLAFADPPYNLQKSYDSYADALAEKHYIEWCNAWLEGMAHTLKPGGSLVVLNLPKWAIHHAAFLNRHLEFRHWIVWDALSDPRGKLMPAHYALLYYTKPGGKPVFNYSPVGARRKEDFVPPPESPKYCLRASCVKARKARGDDEKVELSDIWFDIHRIKHKRDRDAHPCQLPEKLLERIIKLTTRRGGLVFDPFCGAGTTAIAAAKLGRKFVVVDTDPNYVRITREKLAAMKQHARTNGEFTVPRNSVARPRAAGSKRGIELYLQNLARKLGRVPTEDDVVTDQPDVLRQIDSTYRTRSAAFKRAKVALADPV